MRVLLTGGTGLIGSAVLARLLQRGHEVIAAVRSADAAASVTEAGAHPVVGDLTDTAWLTAQLEAVEGAIHTAAIGHGDEAVLAAVLAAFAGTGKRYVHTGGIWTWGDNTEITEDSRRRAPAISAWRDALEERLLASDVRASIVSPAVVYRAGHGIPFKTVAHAPRTAEGALELIGDGEQHWVTVHVDDLAELYVSVLERAPGGQIYIGASGVNPTVRELARAVVGADGMLAPQSVEATRERLGEKYADALLLDQAASGARAQAEFDWHPSRPTLLELIGASGV
jgi:nucleoside-diphosphate-sugar epimerase